MVGQNVKEAEMVRSLVPLSQSLSKEEKKKRANMVSLSVSVSLSLSKTVSF